MKKIFLFLQLVTFSLAGFSQATPSKVVRIADRTTAFGVNLPVGTIIYCASDSTFWAVKTGVATSLTLTTGHASLAQFDKTDLSIGTRSGTTVIINSSTGTGATLAAADGTYAGLMTAADFTKLSGLTSGSGVMVTESFELATSGANKTVILANTPKDSTGVSVSLNGVELNLHTPYNQFDMGVLATKTITFKIPVYQYDAVVVTYTR